MVAPQASPAAVTVPHSTSRWVGPRKSGVALHRPILNPYDKFTASEFTDWIGGITSTLQRALGYNVKDDEEEKEASAVASALARAADESEEETSPVNADALVEPQSSGEDVPAEDSFAYVKSRRAKGKARDPRDGPGFGGQTQPIELLTDSEEEESDGVIEDFSHGEQESLDEDEDAADGEEVDEEDEDEEGESGEDYGEQSEEDRNVPSSSGVHALEYVSSGSEEDEEAEEETYSRQVLSAHLVYFQDATQDAEDELIDSAGESDVQMSDEDDEEEHVDIASSNRQDAQRRKEDDEDEDSASLPRHDEEEGPLEIPDPWLKPSVYAEDLYTGGDILEADSPNHLTPRLRAVSPGLHLTSAGPPSPEIINVDSGSESDSAAQADTAPVSRTHEYESGDEASWDWNNSPALDGRQAGASGRPTPTHTPPALNALPPTKASQPSDLPFDSDKLGEELVHSASTGEPASSSYLPSNIEIPIDPALLIASIAQIIAPTATIFARDASTPLPSQVPDFAELFASNNDERESMQQTDEELYEWGLQDVIDGTRIVHTEDVGATNNIVAEDLDNTADTGIEKADTATVETVSEEAPSAMPDAELVASHEADGKVPLRSDVELVEDGFISSVLDTEKAALPTSSNKESITSLEQPAIPLIKISESPSHHATTPPESTAVLSELVDSQLDSGSLPEPLPSDPSLAPEPTLSPALPEIVTVHGESTTPPAEPTATETNPGRNVVFSEAELTADEPMSTASVEEVDPDIFAPLVDPSPAVDPIPIVEKLREILEEATQLVEPADYMEKDAAAGARMPDAKPKDSGRDQPPVFSPLTEHPPSNGSPITGGDEASAAVTGEPATHLESEQIAADEVNAESIPQRHHSLPKAEELPSEAHATSDETMQASQLLPVAAEDVSDEAEPPSLSTGIEHHVSFVEQPEVKVIETEIMQSGDAAASEESEYIVEEPEVNDVDDASSIITTSCDSVAPARDYFLQDEETGDWIPADAQLEASVPETESLTPFPVEEDDRILTDESKDGAVTSIDVHTAESPKDDGLVSVSSTIPAPISADPNVPDPAQRTPSPSPSISEFGSPIVSRRSSYTLSAVPASIWKELAREHSTSDGLFTPADGSNHTTPVASEDASESVSDAESVTGSVDVESKYLHHGPTDSQEALHETPYMAMPKSAADTYEGSDLDADGEDDPDYVQGLQEAVSAPQEDTRASETNTEDPFVVARDESATSLSLAELGAEDANDTTRVEKLKEAGRDHASAEPIPKDAIIAPPAELPAEGALPNNTANTDAAASETVKAGGSADSKAVQGDDDESSQRRDAFDEDQDSSSVASHVQDSVLDSTSTRKRKRLTTADMTATRRITRSQSGFPKGGPTGRSTRRSTRGAPLSKITTDVKGKASIRSNSDSGSIASTVSVRQMLAPASRAASVTSSIDSTQDASSPAVSRPALDIRPPLVHTHTHAFIHHHHGRMPLHAPPPTLTAASSSRLRSRSKTPELSEAVPLEPQTPSSSTHKPGPVRRLPSLNSPVTRSNCRFHKISLPVEENGPRLNFIVPGCSLGDMELMEDEEIKDEGFASKEDHAHMIPDIEALDFSPYMIGVLRQLVGVDLLREQEVFYLPNPGDPLPKKKRRKTRRSQLDKIRMTQSQAKDGSSTRSSTPSVTSRGRREDDDSGSIAANSSRYRSTGSSVGSLSDLESDEEPPAKRHKSSQSPEESQAISAPPMASTRVDGDDKAQASASQPPQRLRRSKRKALNPEAAAYKPGKDEDSDDDPVPEKTGKSRKGKKRSHTMEESTTERLKSKRTRLRKSTSALNPVRPG